MEVIKLDDKIIVKETGSKDNKVIYDSTEDLDKTNRERLTYIETKLRDENMVDEADKIKKYLGKILRTKDIPKMIPTGNYNVRTRVKKLADTIDKFVEEYNLDLNPDFQRGHVWSNEQRVRYIEFILQEGKSNPIYFNHPNWMGSFEGDMVIVDGKQRLTSLLMFLNNEIPVFKELDEENIGFYAKEIANILVDIEIVVNNLKTREQVLEWYLQINKGNVAHTEEEIQRVERMLEKEKEL